MPNNRSTEKKGVNSKKYSHSVLPKHGKGGWIEEKGPDGVKYLVLPALETYNRIAQNIIKMKGGKI